MNKEELNHKIRLAVEQAIREKKDIKRLSELLTVILSFELRGAFERIKKTEPLDLALISYKGRHWFSKGWNKRTSELSRALKNELNSLEEPKTEEVTPTPPEEKTIGESEAEAQTDTNDIITP